MKRLFLFLVLGLAAGAALLFGPLGGKGPRINTADSSRLLPSLTFYTAPTATTPQIPFWALKNSGELKNFCRINVELWKDTDNLKMLMLAGEGDLWLGHLESFALARMRGAPVTLLAITAWKKFYLVSSNPKLGDFEALAGRSLALAPKGSPALALAGALENSSLAKISYSSYEIGQLLLHLKNKSFDAALIPEPFVSLVLEKMPEFTATANLEELFAQRFGGKPRLPIAGIAVNSETAEKYPELISSILRLMIDKGSQIGQSPDLAVSHLPPEFFEYLPKTVVRSSLERDPVLVEPAWKVRAEIERYLEIISPVVFNGESALRPDDSFYWREK